MTITENNYEEYFLLYIDDELNNVQRNAVNTFIQKHPQYKAVLDGLLQTKLTADTGFVFTHINVLLKNEEKEIGIDNYEDYFLLYTDNELSQEDKKITERFVLQHPQLQAGFTLLQQTKLPVEHIEFAGKEKLFKKEKRVIPVYITRFAVAAAFAGVIAFSWLLVSSNKHQNTVAITKHIEQKQRVIKSEQKQILPQKTISDTPPIIAKRIQQKPIKPHLNIAIKTNIEKAVVADIIVDKSGEKNNEQATQQPAETALQTETVVVQNKTAQIIKPLEEISDETATAHTALSLSDNNSLAKPAVYKELNTDDDNHTLYVGSFQLNKAKVNGILKSASHLLGGRAKQNAE